MTNKLLILFIYLFICYLISHSYRWDVVGKEGMEN